MSSLQDGAGSGDINLMASDVQVVRGSYGPCDMGKIRSQTIRIDPEAIHEGVVNCGGNPQVRFPRRQSTRRTSWNK